MTQALPAARRLESAPAKLNLGLRISGRRPDGYHLLESLFVPIDWGDEVRVTLLGPLDSGGDDPPSRVELVLSGGGAEVPGGSSNLAARAAEEFLARAASPQRVRVELDKRLPAAAGLGGGSSDAGAVLRALDQLLPNSVPGGELAAAALSLGADVPFFLEPRPAWVRGIGEEIEPVSGLQSFSVLLANCGESLATAEVYGIYDELCDALTPAGPGSTMRALSGLQAASPSDPEQWTACLRELLVNDLELAACRLCPAIRETQDHMLAVGAEAVGMSGSGATVFGVFPDRSAAEEALDRAGSRWTDSAKSEQSASGSGWARVASTMASDPAK